MHRWICPLLLLALSLGPALAGEATPELETVTGRPEVLAGDLIEIEGRRFRLYAIDAPEPGQRCLLRKLYDCGAVSRSALLDLTAGIPVTCELLPAEGPEVARCVAAGYDLSEGMVYTGWALADRAVSEHYIAFEQEARTRNHGLWRGRFVAPWDWRRGTRLAEEAQ
ncbi:MAG: thermonuclease family protein [Kiloniellales bacterium]|nr:thermonuclease family protein [Kiloniellales bacterium]MDJ0981270.1 thermonuclease family protein [Kiloniellales bacterium]